MPAQRTYKRASDGRFGSTAGLHTRKASPTGGGIAGAAADLLAGGPEAAGGVTAYVAKAKALKAAAGRAKAKRSGGGSWDPEKHPRGADGKFISKAKVAELMAAGQWPPVPITKPTKAKTARPKPQAKTSPAKLRAEIDRDLARLRSEREAATARLDSAARVELDELERLSAESTARETRLEQKAEGRRVKAATRDAAANELLAENALNARIRSARADREREIAAREAVDREARKVADREIEFTGDTSERFKDQVRQAVLAIPESVRERYAAAGGKVFACRRLTDRLPRLKGEQPRGWAEGTTWDHADGIYSFLDSAAVVSERKDSAIGELVSARVVGVLHHEYGHGVDFRLGNLSRQKAFIDAHAADVARMSEFDREVSRYFIQEGYAGREEAFAEAFACLFGEGAGAMGSAGFQRRFPNVTAVVRSQLGL